MRKLKRLFIIGLCCLFAMFAIGCDSENCQSELPVETFDEFTEQVFQLLIGQDELTVNYLFENPENFGLEHYEPSLPTPGLSSAMGKVYINYTIGQIKRYDYEKLSEDQKMTYNIILNLVDNINAKTTEMGYLSNNYLGSYLGYQAQLPLLLVEYNFRSVLDVENYFKYLDLVPETFKTYVDFEIEKADNGYGMPDFVIDKVVTQCDNFINKASSSEHFMITVVNQKIDACEFLTDEEKIQYKTTNIEKVHGPLIEGYQYVKDELPKLKGKATNNMGLAHYVTEDGYEIGKEYYQIEFQDTVGYKITADEAIKYLGEKIAKYRNDIEYYKLQYQTNQLFRTYVDADINFTRKEPEELLAHYQTAFDNYFPPLTSKPKLTIKYIDKSMEDNFSPAAYMTSAIDNFTEEYIYLNKADVVIPGKGWDLNYLYTTIAHEGYPGHLYQNVYFKSKDVNILRKVLKSSGYVEGWATYAEIFSYELLRENGDYPDIYVDYLILNEEYNAAIHSRIDIGIHYEGWDQEDLKKFVLTFNSTVTDDDIRKMFEQLVEIPNNYQQYFFTYLKLKDLQLKVKNIAKDSFDYKTFHQYILDCGPMPLRYVEEYVLSKYE